MKDIYNQTVCKDREDSNLWLSGYEADELPEFSTTRFLQPTERVEPSIKDYQSLIQNNACLDNLPGSEVKASKFKFPLIIKPSTKQKFAAKAQNFLSSHFDLLIDSQPGRMNQFADSS